MDGSVQNWILILIIGGVVLLFGLIGFICCYFKEKFSPLYDLDNVNHEQSFLKVAIREHPSSTSCSGSLTSDDSVTSFRQTLFQIIIDSTQRPSRVKGVEDCNRWSNRLRIGSKKKKSKTPVNKSSSSPSSTSSVVQMMPTMNEEEEEEEHDQQSSKINSSTTLSRDRITM